MVKIVLAEDYKIVRNGIKSLLEAHDGIRVIGDVATGDEVLKLLESGNVPDILMTDINLAQMDGIRLTEEVKHKYPFIKVIILSTVDSEEQIFEAFESGATAYLLKSTSVDELVFIIKQIAADNYQQIICHALGIRMLKRAQRFKEQSFNGNPVLTARELEILTLMAEGLTNHEIAEKTFTSKRTIEGHRQSLIGKMGVKNTAQLIKIACKTGLI